MQEGTSVMLEFESNCLAAGHIFTEEETEWLIKPLTSKANGLLLQQGSFPLIPILTVVSLSED